MGLVQTLVQNLYYTLLLSALEYPRERLGLELLTDTDADLQELVIWLEDKKIRRYNLEERKALKGSPDWQGIYHKYLRDLDCPIQPTADNQQALLEWLLCYAVDLEYGDQADEYNAFAAELPKQQQHADTGHLPFHDLHTPQVQQQLTTLMQLLHIDTSQGSLLGQLQIARDLVRDSIIPSASDASVKHAITAGNLQDVPLGFETGDAEVDVVATVLRLLYIKDLRQLQTAIDQIVVQLQAYTANPRTDASLGKVGH